MKISKAQALALKVHQDTLRTEREAIDATWQRVVTQLAGVLTTLNIQIVAHNQQLALARQFVDNIATELRDAFDEHSERWQESDAGQSALALVEAWEYADLDEMQPVALLLPDRPVCNESLNLPTTEDEA